MPEVQLTNPGGGVLGGDHLDLDIVLEPDARATVCTQGATKVYRGTAGASQVTRLSVADGAVLEYIPHHVIPYAGARWRQRTLIDLAAGASLLTWDALAAGRVARGERFAFDELSSRTTIRRDLRPLAADGYELRGGGEPLGGYSYLATAYLVTGDAQVTAAAVADQSHDALAEVDGTLAAASSPADGVVVMRVLAYTAPALSRALGIIRAISRTTLGLGAPPREVW